MSENKRKSEWKRETTWEKSVWKTHGKHQKTDKNMLPKYTKTMRKHDENFPKTGKNMSPKTEENSVKTLRKQAENKLRKQDNDTCLQVHAR